MRHQEATGVGGAEPHGVFGDAWARMCDAMCDPDLPAASDHGAAEESFLSDRDEKMGVPLRHVSTARLKAALLTTAVHVVRCGGDRLPGVTAAGIRNATRLDILKSVVAVHGRSEDDSQMLGIAIEHALH